METGRARLGRFLAAARRAAGQLARAAWVTFVWDNLRAGTVELAGRPRSFRALMRAGFWLSLLLIVGLPVAGRLRQFSPLLPLSAAPDNLAGSYAPAWIVPVMFGLLALSWAYLLAGALHAHWLARLAILGAFALFSFNLVSLAQADLTLALPGVLAGLSANPWSSLAVVVFYGGWVVLAGLALARWRRPPRPGLEFPIVLAVTTGMFFSLYFAARFGAGDANPSQTPLAVLAADFGDIDTFLAPFLIVSGVEVARLAMALTAAGVGWLRRETAAAGRLNRTVIWAVGLGLFLFYRAGTQWLAPWIQSRALPFTAGALVAIPLFAAVLVLSRRAARDDSLPVVLIPALATLLVGSALLSAALGLLINLAIPWLIIRLGNGVTQMVTGIEFGLVGWLAQNNLRLVTAAALLGAGGVWLVARWRRQGPAAWEWLLLGFGLWLGWLALVSGTGPLARLGFSLQQVSAAVTALLGMALAGAAFRRRLRADWLLELTALALLFWLLGLRDLLSSPLAPLFNWLGAQTLFLCVSLVLNLRGAGAHFGLNGDSPAWPRPTRGLLYYGYALLALTSLLWLSVGHNVDGWLQQDTQAYAGFFFIGVPLALWAFGVRSPSVLGPGPELEPRLPG